MYSSVRCLERLCRSSDLGVIHIVTIVYTKVFFSDLPHHNSCLHVINNALFCLNASQRVFPTLPKPCVASQEGP
jgi:hypothetical protein